MLHVKPQVAINTPFHFQNPVEEQHKMYVSLQTANGFSQTDRQTDILLTEIKVITDLFVIVIREIYVHVYTIMLVC